MKEEHIVTNDLLHALECFREMQSFTFKKQSYGQRNQEIFEL